MYVKHQPKDKTTTQGTTSLTFAISVWVSMNKGCEMGLMVYRPNIRED